MAFTSFKIGACLPARATSVSDLLPWQVSRDSAVENCQEAHVSFESRSALTVIAVAAAAAVGCVHKSVRDPDARNPPALENQRGAGLPHLAMGCLAACGEATYVELSPKGDLCRCWAPNAFQYTFAFPDTPEKLAYSRARWSNGIETVRRCKAQGRAWEPSEDREAIVCLDPSTRPTESSAANQSLPAAALPENVF